MKITSKTWAQFLRFQANLGTQRTSKYSLLFILTAVLLSMVAIAPIKASAASINSVAFNWSSAYGGSIVVNYCVAGKYAWITSEELYPNPRELGSWLKPSGCGSYYIATGVLDGDVIEVGVGVSDSTPGKNLFNAVGTQFFEASRGNGNSVNWRFDRQITSDNAWCNKGNCRFADPNGTPCAKNQDWSKFKSKDIYDSRGHQLAVVFLKYSPTCGTKWVSVRTSNGPLPYIQASITTDWQGGTPTTTWNDLRSATTDVWTSMRLDTEGKAHACGTVRIDLNGKDFGVCFDE